MLRKRLIPLLLLSDEGLVKGKKFSNYRYLGDPINTIKIFNEKGADELIFIDINASNENRLIDIKFVEEVADECYMPFTVGGGISSINDIKQILKAGAEKVSINTKSIIDKEFITEASDYFGSQSIVVSLDINKDWLGRYRVSSNCSKNFTNLNPLEWAKELEALGAGEILLNMVYNDGLMNGYDLSIIDMISNELSIPLMAAGGAGKLSDINLLFSKTKASAAIASSLFVFHGPNNAFLINYPDHEAKLELLT